QECRGEEISADSEPPDEGAIMDQRRASLKPFRISLQNLVRLGLIEKTTMLDIPMPKQQTSTLGIVVPAKLGHSQQAVYAISAFGEAFIRACTRSAATRVNSEPEITP